MQDNLYAFGGNATGVTISYLTVRNFGGEGENQDQGVVNENSVSGWTIDHSTIKDNAGAGVMLGSHNTLSHDCLADNQQYGFNAYSPNGPVGLVLKNNEIAGNDTYNWEAHSPGCGCTGGGKFWEVKNAVIENNWIHDNHSVGLWADTNNRGFEFRNNYISGNYDYGLIYEISYNAVIEQNTFVRNGLKSGPKSHGFPTSAIYISESGSDHRVKGNFSSTFLIAKNSFIDNWGGVILWENADRFCNSPANTSSGTCTLVDPSVATIKSCNATNINQQPYFGDCRWKTQNVLVEDNLFSFKPSDIGPILHAGQRMRIPGNILRVRDLSELEPLPQDGCRAADHVQPEQSFQGEHLHRAMDIHGVRAGERRELDAVAGQALPAGQGEHAQHVERLGATR